MNDMINPSQLNRLSKAHTHISASVSEFIAVDDNLEAGYIRIYASPLPIDIRTVLGRSINNENITTCVEILIDEREDKVLVIDKISSVYGYKKYETQAMARVKEYARFYGYEFVLVNEKV